MLLKLPPPRILCPMPWAVGMYVGVTVEHLEDLSWVCPACRNVAGGWHQGCGVQVVVCML